jgi:hypothetical protein
MRAFVAFRQTSKPLTTLRGTPVVFTTSEYVGEGVVFDNDSVSFRPVGDAPFLARSFYDMQQFREAIDVSDVIFEDDRKPVDGAITIEAAVKPESFVSIVQDMLDSLFADSLIPVTAFRGY